MKGVLRCSLCQVSILCVLFSTMAAQTIDGIRLSAVSPKYLHSNSTSHKSLFSAVAELIDNAYDPDVNAMKLWIDQTFLNGHQILSFTDNGNGMTYDILYKMLSFGFSDKVAVQGHVPIGHYGNGFKSGSMHLGKDAIVLTKNDSGMHVGMLSQSYLEAVQAENVIVPIISFDEQKQLVNSDSDKNLQEILKYSLLGRQEDLLTELDAIPGESGTRIIIWNLKCDKNRKLEFDFSTDKYDIRIPREADEPSSMQEKTDHVPPDSDYSLRAYCSILYLKPRMLIVLRGLKVNTQYVSKNLALTEKDVYRPKSLPHKPVTITFGFNCRNKEHYGMMMYHNNRLIKAYVKVGCQLKAEGVGVVGVIECNYLKPTQNKQEFDDTNVHRLTLTAIGEKLNSYWKMIKEKQSSLSSVPIEDEVKHPNQKWVQCDSCIKWRKLPDGMEAPPDGKEWFCRMNSDPQFRDCNVPEEPEDDDEITRPTYEKTPKKRKVEQPSQVSDNPTDLPNSPRKKIQRDLNMDKTYDKSASSSNAPSLVTTETSARPSTSRGRPKHLNAQEPSQLTAKKPPNIVREDFLALPSGSGSDNEEEVGDNGKKEEADDNLIIMEDIILQKPKIKKIKSENDAGLSPISMENLDQPSGLVNTGAMTAVTTKTERPEETVEKKKDAQNSYGNFESCQEMSDEQASQQCDGSIRQNQQNHSPAVQDETENYKNRCEEPSTKQTNLAKTVGQKLERETSTGDIKYDQVLKKISSRLILMRKKLQELKSKSSTIGEVDNTCEIDDVMLQLDDILRELDSCSAEKDHCQAEIVE